MGLISVKAELRSASTEPGAVSVTKDSLKRRPRWCADRSHSYRMKVSSGLCSWNAAGSIARFCEPNLLFYAPAQTFQHSLRQFKDLSLVPALVPSFWIGYTVLGRNPLCWIVADSLNWGCIPVTTSMRLELDAP